MFIKNYGLFWHADEIDWFPGRGEQGAFRLLGRIGKNLPGLRLADFRNQQGIYILYSNHGAYYTGLTLAQGLGKRLKDHFNDHHFNKWNRFSWFGFKQVLKGTDDHGLCKLKELAELSVGDPKTVVRDVEALLVRAMGLSNIAQPKFSSAEEWFQVELHERKTYFEKVWGTA
jgi:hypothetical protein